jgi:hypothetical protein
MTGQHIRIYALDDTAKFAEPKWDPELILRNACYGQDQ